MAAGYVAKILNPGKILSVLRQYPVFCGDHAADRLTTKTVLDPLNNPVQDVKADGTAQDYLHLPKASRISHFDLRPETQQNGKPWLKLHLEFQETSTVHTSHGKAKKLRPVFYLPYKRNSMTRMKLSPPPGYGGPDVVFFATATINGCTVYIEGPADTPKVAHANASSYQSVTASGLTWAQKQARIQQKSTFMDQRFAPLKKTTAATLAERRDYMAVQPRRRRRRAQEQRALDVLPPEVRELRIPSAGRRVRVRVRRAGHPGALARRSRAFPHGVRAFRQAAS